MSPSSHFAQVVLILAAVTWPESWQQLQCYRQACSTSALVDAADPYQCCVEREGLQFESGPTAESCSRCEVIGWREESVVASEGSTVTLFFGYIKGTASNMRRFQVEFSGNANITVEHDSSDIEIGTDDGNVTLHFAVHSSAEESASNRTVTLTLVEISSESVNRFISPSVMSVTIIVPQVQFEQSHYYSNVSNSNSVPLCLVFNYAPAEGSAVDITVTKEDDVNNVVSPRKVEFSGDSTKSCQDISIPKEDLDPKMDSVFLISIKIQPGSPLVLGATSTATLTVSADDVDKDGDGKNGDMENGGDKNDGDKNDANSEFVGGSDDSDDSSWIIAVSVVVPTVVLGTLVATAVVVGIVYYKYKHSTHSNVSP